MTEALLKVQDVTVARGGLSLLSDLSFEVSSGNALALRGPNGVGKTTLLRTLAGLQPARRGEIVAEPAVFSGHADAVKPTLSVGENLAFWSAVYGGGDVGSAMEAFSLADLSDRLAGTLSAGQKRRLGLARLLVAERRLWLLDEPTVSLDASSVETFANVLGRHLAGGGAAVIATHVDFGVEAPVLDLGGFAADADAEEAIDEAFL